MPGSRKFPILGVFVLQAAAILGACVSQSYSERVVERNKRYPPTWSQLTDGSSWVDKGYVWYLAVKRGVVDLPLGVRSARLAALNGLTHAADTRVLAGEVFDQTSTAAEPGVKSLSAKANPILTKPEVFDIYFEKRLREGSFSDPEQQYSYDIFVLTRAKASDDPPMP